MGDIVVRGQTSPPTGPPPPEAPVNLITVDTKHGGISVTCADSATLTDAVGKWAHLPQNKHVLEALFRDLDPKQIQPFLDSKGLFVAGTGTLPPAKTLERDLRDWLVAQAMARLPTPTASAPTLGDKGGTLDIAAKVVSDRLLPPASMQDAVAQLQSIDSELLALAGKLKQQPAVDNAQALEVLFSRLQARRVEVDQARAQFAFGGALTPPTDAEVEKGLAAAEADPSLKRVLSRMDSGEHMLAAMQLFIPKSGFEGNVFDRLSGGNPDERKALERELKVFVATGAMSPRLAAIWSNAQHSAGPQPTAERVAYLDCAYLAQFMMRVQKHKLSAEMKLEKTALEAAMHRPMGKAERDAVKADYRQRMDAIAGKLHAVDVAFRPIGAEWAEDNRVWLATVERERNHDLRKAGDPKLSEQARIRWAELAAHKGKAAGESYAHQAKTVARGGHPERAMTLVAKAADSYRIGGDAEVIAGDLGGKPLAAAEVPGYSAASAELETAKAMPGAKLDDTWFEASGKLKQGKATATGVLSRVQGLTAARVAEAHDYTVGAYGDFVAGRAFVDAKLTGVTDPKESAKLRERGALLQDEATRQAAKVLESKAALHLARVDKELGALQKPQLAVSDAVSADLALDHAMKAQELSADRKWNDKVKGWFVDGGDVRTLANDVQRNVNDAQLEIAARNKMAQLIRAGTPSGEIEAFFQAKGLTIAPPPSGYSEAGIAELQRQNAERQVYIADQSLRITRDVTFHTSVDDAKIADAEDRQKEAIKSAVLQMAATGDDEATIKRYLDGIPSVADKDKLFDEAKKTIAARVAPAKAQAEAAREALLLDAAERSDDKVSAGDWRARVEAEARASATRAGDVTLAPDVRRTLAQGAGAAVSSADTFDEQLKTRHETALRIATDQAKGKRKELEADGKERDRQAMAVSFDNALADSLEPAVLGGPGIALSQARMLARATGGKLPGEDAMRAYNPIRWLKDTELKEKQLAATEARIIARGAEADALESEVAIRQTLLDNVIGRRGVRAEIIDLAARAYDNALTSDASLQGIERDNAVLSGTRLFDKSMALQAKAGRPDAARAAEDRSVGLSAEIADPEIKAQASAGHRLATRDTTEALMQSAGERAGVTGKDVEEFFRRTEKAQSISEGNLAAVPEDKRSPELVNTIAAARQVEAAWNAFFEKVEAGEPMGTAEKNLTERESKAQLDLVKGERRLFIAKADCIHPLLYVLGGFADLERDRLITGMVTKAAGKQLTADADAERAQLAAMRQFLVGNDSDRAALLGRFTELTAALRSTPGGEAARARLAGLDAQAFAGVDFVRTNDKALAWQFDKAVTPQRLDAVLEALAKTQGAPDQIAAIAEMYKVPAEQLEKWQPVIQGVQEAVIVVVTAAFTAGVGGAAVEGAAVSSRAIMALRALGLTVDAAGAGATLIRVGVAMGHAGVTMALQQGFDIAMRATFGEGSQLAKSFSAVGSLVSLGRINQLGRFPGLSALVIPGADFLIRKTIIEGMIDPNKQHIAERVMTGLMIVAPSIHGEMMHRGQAKASALEAAKIYFPDNPAAQEAMQAHLASFYLGGDLAHMSAAQVRSQLSVLEGRLGPNHAEFMTQFKAAQAAELGMMKALYGGKAPRGEAELAIVRAKAEAEARAVLGLGVKDPLPESALAQIEARMLPLRLQPLHDATSAEQLTPDQRRAADQIALKAEPELEAQNLPPMYAHQAYLQMAAQAGLNGPAAKAFADYAATRYQARGLLGREAASPEATRALTDILLNRGERTPLQLADAIRESAAIAAEPKERIATTVAIAQARGLAFKAQVGAKEFNEKVTSEELGAFKQMLDAAHISPDARAAELRARAHDAAWMVANETGRPLNEADLARYTEVLDGYNKTLGGELSVDRMVQDARLAIASSELASASKPPSLDAIKQRLAKTGIAGAELDAAAARVEAAVQERVQWRERATAEVGPARAEIARIADDGATAHDADIARALVGLRRTLTDKAASGAPDAQGAAQLRFLDQFGATGFSARLRGRGILADGVEGTSPRMTLALIETLQRKHSSVDFAGAANIDHLATVFEGALAREAAAKHRPLTQKEVDQIALETVLTDATGKGRSPGELADMKLAMLSGADGKPLSNDGRAFWTHGILHETLAPNADPKLKAALEDLLAGSADFTLSREALAAAKDKHGLSDEQLVALQVALHLGQKPNGKVAAAYLEVLNKTGPIDYAALQKAHGLSEGELKQLKGGTTLFRQPFMAGTLMHGLPDFATVQRAVRASGGDAAQAQRTYEAVLGHHMAGFVAAGLARTGVKIDFAGMAKQGHLSEATAKKLETLYSEAVALGGKWRSVIDSTLKQQAALSKEQRAEMAKDAAKLATVVKDLPEHIQSQLINDDSQQFTPVGIPKWLGMFNGPMAQPKTSGELIATVFREPLQGYHEENIARGTGDDFLAGTKLTAERLGMTYDAYNKHYRAAEPGEPAHKTFAEQIARDAESAALFVRDNKLPFKGRELLQRLGKEPALEKALVEWMRKRPPDTEALSRIAQLEAPRTRAADATGTVAATPPTGGTPIDPRRFSRAEPGRVKTPEQQRFDALASRASELGLRSVEEIREVAGILGLNDKSPLFRETGAPRVYAGEDLAPTLAETQRTLGKPDGPVSAFVARSEIFNMGGINGAGGAAEANGIILGTTAAYDARLRSIVEADGGQVMVFHVKGGDMATVITFAKGEPAAHEALVKRAIGEAKAYAEAYMATATMATKHGRVKLSEVANPKVQADPKGEFKGSKLEIAFVTVKPGETGEHIDARAVTALASVKTVVPEGAKYSGPPTRAHPTATERVPFDPLSHGPVRLAVVGGKPGESFASVDHRRAYLVEYLRQRGVPKAQAEALFGEHAKRDRMLGFLRGEERVPTMRALIDDLAGAPEGTKGYYIEADVANLGGMSKVIGDQAADGIYREIGLITYNEIAPVVAAAGGQAVFVRKGVGEKLGEDSTPGDALKAGDEFAIVIKMPPGVPKPEQQLRVAMMAAETKVTAFVDAHTVVPESGGKPVALREIVHPKKPTKPEADGTGLTWGMSEVNPGASLHDNFSVADVAIEAKKKQPTKLVLQERIAERLGVPEKNRPAAAQALMKLYLAQADPATKLEPAEVRRRAAEILGAPPKGFGGNQMKIALHFDVHGMQAAPGEPPELSPPTRQRVRVLDDVGRDTLDMAMCVDAAVLPAMNAHPDAVPLMAAISQPHMRAIFGDVAYTAESFKFARALGRDYWTLATVAPAAARDLWAAHKAGKDVGALIKEKGFDAAVLALRIPRGGDELVTQSNVPVGKPVATQEQAAALVRRITAGDMTAFEALGVKAPPQGFEANQIEWGIGKLPDGRVIVIRGQVDAVNWGGFPGVVALAHSHPLWDSKLLSEPSMTFAELLAGKDHDLVNVMPSAADVRFCAERGIDGHVVHTPYAFLGDGRIGNPVSGKEPRVDMVIDKPERAGVMADTDVAIYKTKLVARANGEVVWSGEVWTMEIGGGSIVLNEPPPYLRGPAGDPLAKPTHTKAGAAKPSPPADLTATTTTPATSKLANASAKSAILPGDSATAKPAVKRPAPGMTNDALAFLKPLKDDQPFGGASEGDGRAAPARIAAMSRMPLLPLNPEALGAPLTLSFNEGGAWGAPHVVNIGGTEMLVQVYGEAQPDARRYRTFVTEAYGIKVASELGIGPKFHGIVDLGDGRLALATDYVKGGKHVEDAAPLIRDWTVDDLYRAIVKLRDKGLDVVDFRYIIDPQGHVKVIGLGGLKNLDPSKPEFSVGELLSNLRASVFGDWAASDTTAETLRAGLQAGAWYAPLADAQKAAVLTALDNLPKATDVKARVDRDGTVWLLETVYQRDGSWQWKARPFDKTGVAKDALFESFEATGKRKDAAINELATFPPVPPAPKTAAWRNQRTPERMLTKIDNQISSAMKPKDVAGVYADRRGQPVMKREGVPFQHEGQMAQARVAVADALQGLKDELVFHPRPTKEREFILAAIARGEAVLNAFDSVLVANPPQLSKETNK